MTEADYEYLLRTLSDASSRATEIVFGVRSRVGADHRLSELGASAVAQIETVLRELRLAAEDEAEAARGDDVRSRVQFVPDAPARASERAAAPASTPPPAYDTESEHWFPGFLKAMLEQFRSSGGITFETVERALQDRKQEFTTDLEIARKMYRTYPHLFQQNETTATR